MALANATPDASAATSKFKSMKAFRREYLKHNVPTSGGGMRRPSWQEPVKEIIGKIDVDTLNKTREAMRRADERAVEKKLALQLIDIGWKALASKLHPDKGGSRDAMTRLNRVRDRWRVSAA